MVSNFYGMQGVCGSIPHSSTTSLATTSAIFKVSNLSIKNQFGGTFDGT
jgi:hypothetical protein